jgi:hypothetical protein
LEAESAATEHVDGQVPLRHGALQDFWNRHVALRFGEQVENPMSGLAIYLSDLYCQALHHNVSWQIYFPK